MGVIDKLKVRNPDTGEPTDKDLYPVTSTKAVYDESNHNLEYLLSLKQNKLVAGDNIKIDPVTNIISSEKGNNFSILYDWNKYDPTDRESVLSSILAKQLKDSIGTGGGGGGGESLWETIDVGPSGYSLPAVKPIGRNIGVVSDSFITAGGINSLSDNTYDRLDDWANYIENKGQVLSAKLGVELNNKLNQIIDSDIGNISDVVAKVNKNTTDIIDLFSSTTKLKTDVTKLYSGINTINSDIVKINKRIDSIPVYFQLGKTEEGQYYITAKTSIDSKEVDLGIVSNSFISAGKINSTESSSGSYERLSDWQVYDRDPTKGDLMVLGANLGNKLRQDILSNTKEIAKLWDSVNAGGGPDVGGIIDKVNKNTEDIKKHETRLNSLGNQLNTLETKLYFELKDENTSNPYVIPKLFNGKEVGIVSNTFITAGKPSIQAKARMLEMPKSKGVISTNVISDSRLEENINRIDEIRAKKVLNSLQPIEYTPSTEMQQLSEDKVSKTRTFDYDSFIQAIPEANDLAWGEYKTLKLEQVIPYLVAGYQSLIQTINTQQIEINNLKNKLNNGNS